MVLIIECSSSKGVEETLTSSDPKIVKAVDIFVDWTANKIFLNYGKETDFVQDALVREVGEVVSKCPKCGKLSLEPVEWNSDIYGWYSGVECKSCGYQDGKSGPPAWFERETAELQGKGRYLPSGDWEYKDEYGGY